jgi:methyl-accepting chemotaxis protein
MAKGGRAVFLQASYNPVKDGSGRVVSVVKFATDVTPGTLLSADYLGQIEATRRTGAVIEFKLDGTILYANDVFLKSVGYTLPEIVGRHHSMFVEPAEVNAPAYLAFWAALARGESQLGEFKRRRKDGREMWLVATYNAIRDPDGKPSKVVQYATDITSQVEARSGFSELISRVAGNVEEMTRSIREISETMGRSQVTAQGAVKQVQAAGETTQRLSTAVQAMDRIVDLIGTITSQINLLALNATIESARAGEAGRGFAVVANEVKSLAQQARTATEDITREINGIRAVSDEVVSSLAEIRGAFEGVMDSVLSTSAAVEQQSAVTEAISSNMKLAAERTQQLWAA